MSALTLALLLVGDPRWPQVRFWPTAILTIAFGLAYTAFSEWLNVAVRHSWAYSELMPIVPILNLGLSPLAQWILVPALGFSLTRRWTARGDALRFE